MATRRLRSLLRTLRPIADEAWIELLRERLRSASDVLSEARDADVTIGRIVLGLGEIDAIGRMHADALLERLERTRTAAYDCVMEMRRDPSHAQLMRDVREAGAHPMLVLPAAARVKGLMRGMLRKTHRRLRTRVKRCGPDPTDETLHGVRIAAKHVRYALEAFEPVLGAAAARVARRLARLQDVLGEEHDATVTVARLRESESGDAAFAAGQLVMVERDAIARARRAWRKQFERVERAFSQDRP